MADTIRWGILGAAKFARLHMGPAIHAARGATLAALATSDAAKADPFRAIAPGLRVHGDYDALLSDEGVDAIYIPLPNHLHVEWTLKALAAGKAVLVEKPVALAAAEIDALIDARDSSGLLAAEAYMIVHHPQWQRARALLAEGAIGRLIAVDAAFSYGARDDGNIRNRPETGGGGLRDIGVYTMGSVRFATGEEPQAVRAEIEWRGGVDMTAHVVAEFPGFRFQGMTSMRRHPRQEVVFHGSDGVLRLPAPYNAGLFGEARIELARNVHNGGAAQTTVAERWPDVNQYVLQVEAFCDTLRTGAPYPWTLEDARGTQAMIDACFAAAGPAPA